MKTFIKRCWYHLLIWRTEFDMSVLRGILEGEHIQDTARYEQLYIENSIKLTELQTKLNNLHHG